MILFKFLVATYVISNNLLWSNFPFSTKRGSAMEAKLHTAISSGAVYSMISVHRFDERMVPKFFWFDFPLQASLYSMYGLPVSICASNMAFHRSRACMVLRPLFSFSYFVYKASNSFPWQSAKPGASLGQNSVQVLLSFTRCMNRSAVQRAVNRSRARASSLPWFLRMSKKSKISACHGSK